MLSLQAARAQPPSSYLKLLFSPFAHARHCPLRAQRSGSTAAANTAAERDPPQRPSTGCFLNTGFFLSAGSLRLHLYGEIKCAGDCFLVLRSSSAAWLVPHFSPLRTITSLQACGAGSHGPVSKPSLIPSMGMASISFLFVFISLFAFVFFPALSIP